MIDNIGIMLLFFIALYIRLYLCQLRFFPEGDGCRYIGIATNILKGNFKGIGISYLPGISLLMAVFANNVHTLEMTGRIISSVAGAGTVVVSFFLARDMFSRAVAWVSAFAITFNMHLLRFSTFLFGESCYTFLIVLFLYFLWRAYKKPSLRYIFFTGIIIGCGYLFRMEALFFVVPVMIYLIYRNRMKTVPYILGLYLGVGLVLFPLALYYKATFHRWTIGRKGIGLFLYGGKNARDFKCRWKMTDDFHTPQYLAIVQRHVKKRGILTYCFEQGFFIKRLQRGFIRVGRIFPELLFRLPIGTKVISVGAFILGTLWCLTGAVRWRSAFILLIVFPLLGSAVVSLVFAAYRYLVPFIPFFLIIESIGFVETRRFLKSVFSRFILYCFIAVIFTASAVQSFGEAHIDPYAGVFQIMLKQAGLWMNRNIVNKSPVVAYLFFVPYYYNPDAPRDFSPLIYSDYSTLIRYMQQMHCKYLVVYKWMCDICPSVKYLFSGKRAPELDMIRTFKRKSHEIRIYRLIEK